MASWRTENYALKTQLRDRFGSFTCEKSQASKIVFETRLSNTNLGRSHKNTSLFEQLETITTGFLRSIYSKNTGPWNTFFNVDGKQANLIRSQVFFSEMIFYRCIVPTRKFPSELTFTVCFLLNKLWNFTGFIMNKTWVLKIWLKTQYHDGERNDMYRTQRSTKQKVKKGLWVQPTKESEKTFFFVFIFVASIIIFNDLV